ncbi:MAG: class I SAM-dependent methyltransferase [Pseudomonadota bacterium]
MSEIDRSQADWANYWSGREAGQTGEVLAGTGIENQDELSAFWNSVFAEPQTGLVLDLACGAGSAIKHATASDTNLLIGLDISSDAILAAQAKVPGLTGIIAAADAIPLADGSVSHVISQFGFEYSNRQKAAVEISRVLAPGGHFTAVVHLKDGAIAEECQGHLAKAELISTSGYFSSVRDLFTAAFEFDAAPTPDLKQRVSDAGIEFSKAQATLAPIIKEGGIAGRLHAGARQLFERRQAYLPADISTWLDQMAHEIDAYAGRMRGMLASAIDKAEANSIVTAIADNGHGGVQALSLSGSEAAWVLTARRP